VPRVVLVHGALVGDVSDAAVRIEGEERGVLLETGSGSDLAGALSRCLLAQGWRWCLRHPFLPKQVSTWRREGYSPGQRHTGDSTPRTTSHLGQQRRVVNTLQVVFPQTTRSTLKGCPEVIETLAEMDRQAAHPDAKSSPHRTTE